MISGYHNFTRQKHDTTNFKISVLVLNLIGNPPTCKLKNSHDPSMKKLDIFAHYLSISRKIDFPAQKMPLKLPKTSF